MYQSHPAPRRVGESAGAAPTGSLASLPAAFRRSLLLVAAFLLLLPLIAAAARTQGEPARPVSVGGAGLRVELPPTWMMEPAHLYRRQVFVRLQVELPGMGMGTAPMEARTRQEVTFRTSHPDEDGHLYALLTLEKPEVLEGSPELARQLEAAGAARLHLRVTPQGDWEVLKAEDGEGRPLPEDLSLQGIEGMILPRGPVWPEAPRPGSTWQIPLSELAGSAVSVAVGSPEGTVTATLEAVEGLGAGQLARIGYRLPPESLDLSLGEAGSVQAWLELEGWTRVRVHDGWPVESWLRVMTRTRMPGMPGSGEGVPEMVMRVEVEEHGLAAEPLADPPDRPW